VRQYAPPPTSCTDFSRAAIRLSHRTGVARLHCVTEIDVALVRRLVDAQFPQWADLPVSPVEVGGWDNRTFRLGERMTVRLPSAEGYVAQVAKEQRWLPYLAPRLPLPIPVPLAQGVPAEGYPFPWSVYPWLDGENAGPGAIGDLSAFAVALAGFLTALQSVDATGGPPPGPHCWYRGGPLTTYDAETRRALETLGDRIDRDAATDVWETALAATWHGTPVWFHGDVSAGNLLVRDGRLAAVIDFGSSGVGDPACDLAIAWTLLSGESREAFRDALSADPATWARGRGWTVWKSLITLADEWGTGSALEAASRHTLDEVLADRNNKEKSVVGPCVHRPRE
jgi:aminoglycoside phosphotransferase (APT) family kinase protein